MAMDGEQFDHHRGRGEGQCRADQQGCRGWLAEGDGDDTDRGGRERDLAEAKPEDQPAHGLQALIGQLQADDEEEKGDAELGRAGERLGTRYGDGTEIGDLGDEAAESIGAEHGSAGHERDDRVDAEALRKRHDHAGRGEHDHGVAIGGRIDRPGHVTL
jgi:hypothetical protein